MTRVSSGLSVGNLLIVACVTRSSLWMQLCICDELCMLFYVYRLGTLLLLWGCKV